MRLDPLLSKEEEVRVLYTVESYVSKWGESQTEEVKKNREETSEDKEILVPIRSGETPVPIPNTMVKTWAADGTMLETAWESRWVPDYLWGCSSVGRAPALQAGGQEFESLHLHSVWRRKPSGRMKHASMYLENHILNISRKVEADERFARTSNLWKTIQDIRGVIS